jgi:hypothetical protein
MSKCLVTNCKMNSAPALGRGLCMKCHSAAKKMITEGRTTWDELVNMGLALAKVGENFFVSEFNEKLATEPSGGVNPRKLYQTATGIEFNPSSPVSVAKYCDWLEREYSHELKAKQLRDNNANGQ